MRLVTAEAAFPEGSITVAGVRRPIDWDAAVDALVGGTDLNRATFRDLLREHVKHAMITALLTDPHTTAQLS